jgi:hypothetical protein
VDETVGARAILGRQMLGEVADVPLAFVDCPDGVPQRILDRLVDGREQTVRRVGVGRVAAAARRVSDSMPPEEAPTTTTRVTLMSCSSQQVIRSSSMLHLQTTVLYFRR